MEHTDKLKNNYLWNDIVECSLKIKENLKKC